MTKEQIVLAERLIINFIQINESNETPIIRRLKRKTIKSLKDFITDYYDEIDNLRATHCVKGDKNQIIYNDGEEKKGYAFSEEGKKTFKKAVKEFNKQEVTLDITKVDWNLFSEDEKKFFVFDSQEIYDICKVFIENLPEYKEEE